MKYLLFFLRLLFIFTENGNEYTVENLHFICFFAFHSFVEFNLLNLKRKEIQQATRQNEKQKYNMEEESLYIYIYILLWISMDYR